jgi:hypothetical protein
MNRLNWSCRHSSRLGVLMSTKCNERAKLEGQANSVLEKLVRLTNAQLEVFQARNHAEFMRLDRELELTVGEKERTIGAVRQHIQEHGCDY